MTATSGLGGQPRYEYRNVLALLYDTGWKDADNLLQMGCTVDAESGCYPHAWHWNSPAEGGDGSTDWGMFQLNDGHKGGTAPAVDDNNNPVPTSDFQRKALDPANAAVTARSLYQSRGFEPWFGHAKWKNYAPAMTRAVCNFLRDKHGITPLL